MNGRAGGRVPDENVELEHGDVVALREVDGAAQLERLLRAAQRVHAVQLLAEAVPGHDACAVEGRPPPIARVGLRDLEFVACARATGG